MPRKPRHWVPGQGAHIISRFVDRRFCLADDVDRRELFESITRAHDWVATRGHTYELIVQVNNTTDAEREVVLAGPSIENQPVSVPSHDAVERSILVGFDEVGLCSLQCLGMGLFEEGDARGIDFFMGTVSVVSASSP